MKAIVYRLLSFVLWAFCILWPTSCARIVDVPMQTDVPIAKGNVIGRISLPKGTAWSTDELTVISHVGDHVVKQGKFSISTIDTTRYKVVFGTYQNGEIALISPLVNGQNNVTIDANSTALALLMVTPFTSLVQERDKPLMLESFRKHSQFPALVSTIETLVKLQKPLLDDANISLFSLLNSIQVGTAKSGGRKAFGPQQLQANADAIDFALNLPAQGQVRLTNNGSALPYFAALYTSNGTPIGEPINLESLRITNTGLDKIWDAVKNWITNSNALDECHNAVLSSIGSSAKPPVFCDLFKLEYPTPKTISFPTPGKYTIKVMNSKVDDGNSELQAATEWKTMKNLVYELIGGLDATFDKTLEFVDCTRAIYLAALKTNLGAVGQNNLDVEPLNRIDRVRVFLKTVSDFVEQGNKCNLLADGDGLLTPKDFVNKKYIKLAFKLLDKALKILDLPAQFGAALNVGIMARSAVSFEPYYEYCVEFDGSIVTYCTNSPTDTPLPNQVEEASTSVSTADPHMTTFDRGRYDFMAVGEFVAAKSTTDNFQVQVRQAPYPSSTQVSVNTGVAMLVDNDRVCVYPGPSRLYVNNQAINLSFTEYPLSGGGSIQYANGNLSIKNRNGDRIEVKLLGNDLDYFITPAKNRSGKLAGLFGNYDGNPSNDLVQANGTRVSNTYRELYPAFADSWRITQNQSLFVYETGKTTDSYTDKNFPRSEIQLTASQRTAAEQTCRQAGVTDPDALEGCIVDVALTGNQTFAERAKQNQIISNAKSILSASNFSQYRNEFTLSSDATVNGSTVLLNSKGTIGWNDAYLNRDGYETEIVLSVNAPTPCFPLFDINVMDNTATGDPNQNYLRLSANGGKTQVELVNSGSQPQQHPVNLFDGNRHRIRIATTKALSGSQTTVRILIYIDNYEPLTINRSYASSSLAGYLYPMLKNETINCSNGQITIFGWSFKSQ